MSEIELITDGGRRHRGAAADKLQIGEETMNDGESISAAARRNGVARNLLYRLHEEGSKTAWGAVCLDELMLEGGRVAMAGDNSVTGNKTVQERLMACW